ncbi:MAG: prepilin-type N-terminal cleavage/methylation domain-containing protein [Planctomycetaceae bacterium]|nr:prepilin-type N-terminal cleavage/methylation domain-containing protein [Planctomycetaceae bacterium]
MKNTPNSRRTRNGFTLVELVVVVLVLGIIAAVAAPRMFDTAGDARQNGTTTSLAVVRDAIELHRAQNGTYPGDAGTQADLVSDLQPFLRGAFPSNQLPAAANDGSVRVETAGTALSASGAQDWAYDNSTGEFIINTSGFDTL